MTIDLPLVISSISLSVAAITLYLAQLKPAKINIIVGPEIQTYHGDFPKISTGFYIPITFANFSSNMGVINKCAITVFRKDSSQRRYFITWREFAKMTDKGWGYDSEAHSFAIPGKSSISKVAWFMWFQNNETNLILKEGSYQIHIHVWIENRKKPVNFKRSFYIPKEHETILENRIQNESRTSIRIILNQELERNQLLSNYQAEELLNDKSF